MSATRFLPNQGARKVSVAPRDIAAIEREPVGVVHEAIKDGICDGGIADDLVPVLDPEVTGHDGGAATVAGRHQRPRQNAGDGLVFINRTILAVKQRFVGFHEAGHGFLPWQRPVMPWSRIATKQSMQ